MKFGLIVKYDKATAKKMLYLLRKNMIKVEEILKTENQSKIGRGIAFCCDGTITDFTTLKFIGKYDEISFKGIKTLI